MDPTKQPTQATVDARPRAESRHSEDDLCFLPASEQARLIASGGLSPVDLVASYLARIERVNPMLNAYVTVDAEGARAAAKAAAEALAGGKAKSASAGSLHGVPFGLKDLYWTKGLRTTGGSKILKDLVPEEDAESVARLRAAGAIVLGKLHTTEFATSPLAQNDHWGTCRNPWNTERNPGGSSSGSGAAIGGGIAGSTLGSDTGGSIRIPAALCGAVGLKPTYGRVSRHGVVPLSWTLDHAGPITRTARDAALVLGVIAGHDPKDASTGRVPVPDYVAALDGNVRGLRLGVPEDFFFHPVDPEVRDAVYAAIGVLERLGARRVAIRLPVLGSDALRAPGPLLSSVEMAAYHGDWLRERPEDYGAFMLKRLNTGATVLATDYLKVMRGRELLRQEITAAFDECDVIVTPTTPRTATDLSGARVTVDGVSMDMRAMTARLTRPFNMSGHPSVAVPCGFGADGLPMSLQIAGRAYDEATILKVADAYQQATDWHTRRPPL